MSCVNIDGKRNVQVAHDGRLLKNMTQRIRPETDEDGLAYILIQSRKDPQEQEQRYLKVLVFEHHSSIAGVQRAKLEKDDVELVDEEKGVNISNLRLTESGLDKVENQNGFKADGKGTVDADDEDTGDGEGEDDDSSEEAPPSHPKPETWPAEDCNEDDTDFGEDQDDDADESEADKAPDETYDAEDDEAKNEESEVDEASPERKSADDGRKPEKDVLTAVPTTEGGSHYDLLDGDGNSVLDTYNDGKKVNGKKNLNEIAEDYEVEIEIKAKE